MSNRTIIATTGLLLTIPLLATTNAAEPIQEKYGPAARRIIDAALASDGAYRKLEELCDDYGHRLSGSEALEKAIGWAQQTLKNDGHENIAVEKVMVPKWVRGAESCEMIAPRWAVRPSLRWPGRSIFKSGAGGPLTWRPAAANYATATIGWSDWPVPGRFGAAFVWAA